MSFLLGLTGSIGMGKSTTAQIFAKAGVPVWDADAIVHRLYDVGGAAVGPIAALFPAAIMNGAVSRPALKALIAQQPDTLRKIEQVVHPLVQADRALFMQTHRDDLLLFDIPLLFETRADSWLDAVVVVTAPPEVQRERVMLRPGMTEEAFQMILAKQMPDAEKRRRADYVIETTTLDAARDAVHDLINQLSKRTDHA